MQVKLDHHTPLYVAAKAIRQCWASQEKSDTVDCICGPNDKALIDRIGNKNKHASTLEHLVYNFTIEGVSRALLQELARHRISSLSVKSTRYTLSELKKETNLLIEDLDVPLEDRSDVYANPGWQIALKYVVPTGEPLVDRGIYHSLISLQLALKSGISNDKAKYCLPEAYKTSLAWTINARSLQNFLSLRSSPHALWEIRDLANAIYEVLPPDHKYLFSDCLVHDVQPNH